MKYIDGRFGFVVEDGAEEHAGTIVSNMMVQAEEPVVGYSDDLSMNEVTIDTRDVHGAFVVYDMIPVDVVSWVYYNGDEPGGGGFDWFPIPANPVEHDEVMRKRFREETQAWKDATAVIRWVRILAPNFGYGSNVAGNHNFPRSEADKQRITDWIEADLDMVESPRDPATIIKSEYVYNDHDGWRVVMKYILDWIKVPLVKDVDDDTKGEIREYLRTYGPEDPPDLAPDDERDVAQELVNAFPLIADEVMRELASTEGWSLADDKVDGIIAAAEKADGMGRWHYAQHGALCGAGDEAFTTGDTDRVTCAACRRLIAEDEEGEYVGPLAPFTKLIDAVYANHEGVVNDVSTGEVGDALLLLDLGDGYALGVSDYTESWWDACLYLDRYELDGALAMFVTESIGRVEVAGDVEQTEVGRRIAYYLNTDQFNIDKETLRRRKGEQ